MLNLNLFFSNNNKTGKMPCEIEYKLGIAEQKTILFFLDWVGQRSGGELSERKKKSIKIMPAHEYRIKTKAHCSTYCC